MKGVWRAPQQISAVTVWSEPTVDSTPIDPNLLLIQPIQTQVHIECGFTFVIQPCRQTEFVQIYSLEKLIILYLLCLLHVDLSYYFVRCLINSLMLFTVLKYRPFSGSSSSIHNAYITFLCSNINSYKFYILRFISFLILLAIILCLHIKI